MTPAAHPEQSSQQAEQSKGLLTEDQAAAHLALCPRTLRKARQSGTLSYVLIGRAVRYTLADLDQFIDNHRRKEAPCLDQTKPKTRARPGRTAQIVPFTARN